jgi:hypothetical protein
LITGEAPPPKADRGGAMPWFAGNRMGAEHQGDLVGEPDLLRKESGGYLPDDIKAGAGEEGGGGKSGGRGADRIARRRDNLVTCPVWKARVTADGVTR